MCLLSNNITDYYYVAQGKTTIPNVDDGEECTLTDVSCQEPRIGRLPLFFFALTVGNRIFSAQFFLYLGYSGQNVHAILMSKEHTVASSTNDVL